MLHYRKHRPNFVDSDNPVGEYDFATLEDLVKHPDFTDLDWCKNFHQFSLARAQFLSDAPYFHLMLELDDGYQWWVLGIITGAEEEVNALGLPAIEYKKRPEPFNPINPVY